MKQAEAVTGARQQGPVGELGQTAGPAGVRVLVAVWRQAGRLSWCGWERREK